MSSKITPYSVTLEIYRTKFHFINHLNSGGKTIHIFGQKKTNGYYQRRYYSYRVNSLCGMTTFNPSQSRNIEKITFSDYINFYNNQDDSLCLSCAKIFNKIINSCNELFIASNKATANDVDLENIEFWELFFMYREQKELHEKQVFENKQQEEEIQKYEKLVEEMNFKIKSLESRISGFQNSFRLKDVNLLEID
jgi:hypothetical protein